MLAASRNHFSPVAFSYFDTMMVHCSPFEQRPSLAVAVSGGADSMALLHLAVAWAKNKGGEVTALTVDHGLRPEAVAEAVQVGRWCADMGVAHHTLTWQPPVSRANLQEKARDGRYALLAAWCRNNHVLHLLTAHTRDDQCETLFFRLARGSHMEGLAAMPLVTKVDGVRLLRPLLHSCKTALLATLEQCNQRWIEDPSNRNPAYARNHIRLQLVHNSRYPQLLEASGSATENFANIRNALFYNNVTSLTNTVQLYPEGYARLDRKALEMLPDDAKIRVLEALISALNGVYHPPRPDTLVRLMVAIAEGRKCTLGGLFFAPKDEHVLIAREKAALPAPTPLPAQHWEGLWDGRFALTFNAAAYAGEFSVRSLGKNGLDSVLQQVKIPSGARVLPALKALPSLWYRKTRAHLEELVAVPHIPYHHVHFENVRFNAVFCSAKPLAGSPFFSLNTTYPNPLQER